MSRPSLRLAISSTALVLAAALTAGHALAQAPRAGRPAPAPPAPTSLTFEAAIANLAFREIGPAAMGGRVDDFAVVESDPSIVYMGSRRAACGRRPTPAPRGRPSSTTRRCRRSAT
jgi:hypothetical protein